MPRRFLAAFLAIIVLSLLGLLVNDMMQRHRIGDLERKVGQLERELEGLTE